jgi:hypothetical protein
MIQEKKIKIRFVPGCFDDFEGTQEELDELVAEIKKLAESGELEEMSTPIDLELLDEMFDEPIDPKKLH